MAEVVAEDQYFAFDEEYWNESFDEDDFVSVNEDEDEFLSLDENDDYFLREPLVYEVMEYQVKFEVSSSDWSDGDTSEEDSSEEDPNGQEQGAQDLNVEEENHQGEQMRIEQEQSKLDDFRAARNLILDDCGVGPIPFQKPPARIPKKSICLAAFLCMAGTTLLCFGLLVLSGNLDAKFSDRVWPMMIMGLLMFIPGAYHVRIAYLAYKGTPGYSFDDIPEFE